MKIRFHVLISLILFSTGVYSQTTPVQNPLEVGVDIVDISGDSAVILDPLHVKAVVIRQGAEMIALVECDIVGVSSEWTTAARKTASLKTGIPYTSICVAATHTHINGTNLIK